MGEFSRDVRCIQGQAPATLARETPRWEAWFQEHFTTLAEQLKEE